MVDLIPQEYRRVLRLRRLLLGFGWTCLGIVIALVLSIALLVQAADEERTALARDRHVQARSKAQQARLAEIKAQKEVAESQLRALDALSGGAPIGRLFDAVDAALNGKIWFQEVEFSRGGEFAGQKAEMVGPVRLAAEGAGKPAVAGAAERGSRPQGRAEIRGIAIDHAALAEFIQRLGARPGVNEVRLLDTGARSYPVVQVVEFHLAALVGAAIEAAQ